MCIKQELAYYINKIVCEYEKNNDVRTFFYKMSKLNILISKNTNRKLYDDYKYDLIIIYNNIIINGEDDYTIIGDCLKSIDRIMIRLLRFE
jgi:hypothetical protein